MKRSSLRLPLAARRWSGTVLTCAALATLVGATPSAYARSDNLDLIVPEAGGLMLRPVITSFGGSNQLTLNWLGFGGPYQVERSVSLAPMVWQPIGPSTTNTSVPLSPEGDMGFLRVQGPVPLYLSAEQCFFCHLDKYDAWSGTAHATALETLKGVGQAANSSCLKCHTAGHGLSTGYKTQPSTPHLAGVQCENCHGPGGGHPAHPADQARQPLVSLSAKVCGGCHNGIHHPTFDEWTASPHANVTPTPAGYFRSTSSVARMLACGACHSGAVRSAMLVGAQEQTPVQLPEGETAASVAITCVVCHDPHQDTEHGGQLRNPLASLMPFSYDTSTNTTFAAQYQADLNLCGQCHNSRGAKWTDTSRYPHYSPQYNILIGNAGLPEDADAPQSAHRNNPKQCADCHTHRHEPDPVTPANPVFTGHDFQASPSACAVCHGDEETGEALKELIQRYVEKQMNTLQAQLDTWATTKADPALRPKYGKLAWEYNVPGHLSNPNEDSNLRGPTSQEQQLIPEVIKQARFSLYLVYQDKSKGIHNSQYVRHLLKTASDKVNALLQN